MPSSNVIRITDESRTVISISVIPGSEVVSSGQDFQAPPTVSQSGRVFTITFLADRHNSSSAADRFNAASGGEAFEYAADGGGGVPRELNFFFSVQLTFSTAQGNATETLHIGQGHYALTNNWWLGGNIIRSRDPSLVIAVADGRHTLTLPLSGSTSSYTFAPGRID